MVSRITTVYAGRLRRLRKHLKDASLDGYVVVDRADIRYLSGFSGHDSILVIGPRRKRIITDSRYVQQIRQECPGWSIHCRKGPMTQAVETVFTALFDAGHAVGVDPDSLTVSQLAAWKKALKRHVAFKTSGGHIRVLRGLKDDQEIRCIRRAVRIAEQAFVAMRNDLRPGMSERQAAGTLDYYMAMAGSEKPGFDTIAAVGPHAAQPHAVPGAARIASGKAVLFDWGAVYDGYTSDLTRNVCAGRIPGEYLEAYQRLLEAQCAAINEVKPGRTLSDIDRVAREILKKSPWPLYGHGTGHGIGLDVHEGPFVGASAKGLLKPGMVVTIEPGIYVPGRFGIRIEDDVLVTDKGHAVLSRLDKTPESLPL